MSPGSKEMASLEPNLTGYVLLLEPLASNHLFAARDTMYFPFLTSEVKCGAIGLDVADRQSQHSASIGIRSLVELFSLVGREKELHRRYLFFSISHNDWNVRIWGHFSIIKGSAEPTYWRELVDEMGLVAVDGKRRWKPATFVKNLYNEFVGAHFKKLCLVIDVLPVDLDFEVPPLSKATGL